MRWMLRAVYIVLVRVQCQNMDMVTQQSLKANQAFHGNAAAIATRKREFIAEVKDVHESGFNLL